MATYLHYWWDGTLAQHYGFLGLTIPQLNKIAKLVQYCSGLLAVFEFIKFSNFMNRLGLVAFILVFLNSLAKVCANLPNDLARVILALLFRLRNKVSIKEAMREMMMDAVAGVVMKGQYARSHPLVTAFDWLENHPVSEETLKRMAFATFVVASAIEILTG